MIAGTGDRTAGSMYAWMYLSNASNLLASLAVYHWVSVHFGAEGFAQYAVARRAVNLLAPAMMLGLGIALPRAIALANTRGAEEGRALFRAAFICVSAAGLMLVAAARFWPASLAGLFFGDRLQAPLAMPLAAFLASLTWHGALWSFYRGCFRFRDACLLDICNLAVVPVVIYWTVGRSTPMLLLWIGISSSAVSLALSLAYIRGRVATPESWRRRAGSLLAVGLPRVPGDFALGGLLALPSLAATHICGLVDAGSLAFGSTMTALAGTAVAPFSTILLPQSALMIGQGKIRELSRHVLRITVAVSGVVAGGVTAGFVLMPRLVALFLGEEYLNAVPVLRLLALSTVPYVVYCLLRSTIDAAFREPVNARNCYLALAVLLAGLGAVYFGRGGVISIAWALFAGQMVLAALTVRVAWGLRSGRLVPTVDAPGRFVDVRRPLRIMAVIPGAPRGASMVFARRQCAALGRLGQDVEIFHLESRTNPARIIRGMVSLARQMRAFRPDVVHAHYGTMTALTALICAPGRLVITFRGSDLNPSRAVSPFRSWWGRLLSQIAAVFAAGVMCVSCQLKERIWLRRDRVLVLPSGVDEQLFRVRPQSEARVRLGMDADARIVVFNCGADPWVKRIELAEAAVEAAREHVPAIQMVVMRGEWEPDQVPWLLAAADCLLITSRHEGSPSIVREALATELPIVSVDVGDVAEQIAGIRNCVVCPADAMALGTAIAGMLGRRQRTDGRSRALVHSESAVAARLLDFYRSCLASGNGHEPVD